MATCISSTSTNSLPMTEVNRTWSARKLINARISRHPGERVILIGDLNGSIPERRQYYAHPMNLAEVGDRLAKFCANSNGTILSTTEFTWKQGEKRAELDHGISWNFHLAYPREGFNDTAHQRFDHAILSFGLPAEKFSRKPRPARKLLAAIDRIGALFFQNHIRHSRRQSKTRCFQPQRRPMAMHS